MPLLVRENPETPCQPGGAHHPHRMVCSDPDCDCSTDTEDGRPYSALTCCVCHQDWPCETKRAHETSRADPPEPIPDEPRKGHLVDTDVAWGGSGRDGDPWVKVSWDVERCYCSQPWRHG